MSSDGRKAGQRIRGRFMLVEPLGTGGFGAVWRAIDVEAGGRPVALKLLHPHLVDEARALERFSREAEILTRLEHPNVARALAWGREGDDVFLAIEYVEGPTLARALIDRAQTESHFALEEVVELVRALAAAVDHAHARGVVHRDLKPANVMLPARAGLSAAKVLDFGIAKIVKQPSGDATTVGRVLGSWLYLAPEQVAGEEVGPAVDVFALGAITFELLTLRRAFARDEQNRPLPADSQPDISQGVNSRYNLLKRIALEARIPPSTARRGLSADLDRAVLGAIAIDARERPATATAFAEALAAAIEAAPRPKATALPTMDAGPIAEETRDGAPRPASGVADTVLRDRSGELEPTRATPPAAERPAGLEPHAATRTIARSEAPTIARSEAPKRAAEPRPASREPSAIPTNVTGVSGWQLGGLLAATMFASLAVTVAWRLGATPDTTPAEPARRAEHPAPAIEPKVEPQATARPRPVPQDRSTEPREPEVTRADEARAKPASAKADTTAKSEARAKPEASAKADTTAKAEASAKAEPSATELDRLFTALRREPNDLERVARFTEALRAEADTIQDPTARTSLKRCIAASAVRGDVTELTECYTRLRSAQTAP